MKKTIVSIFVLAAIGASLPFASSLYLNKQFKRMEAILENKGFTVEAIKFNKG